MLLPEKNPNVSGVVSVFEKLVGMGEERSLVTLSPQLRTFLVDCLAEHLRDRAITQQALALGFLISMEKSGEQAIVRLKRVGDGALLLTGLFPERALRLHVNTSYFRSMGQAAYASIAARLQANAASERRKLYTRAAAHFLFLEKVLRAARGQPETEWGAYLRFRASL
jgi:hypothetical protein